MRTRWPHPWAVLHATAVAAGWLVHSSPAAAQDSPPEADACFTAAERAQPLMKDKRFREARAELEMCARDVCPRVARTDCRNWLSEVAVEQPSVVVAAHEVNPRHETRDVTGVRATIDGGITIERVDATPIPLDPGRHRIRIERAGLDALEQNVEVREGEKSRIVNFYWQTSWVASKKTTPDPPTERTVRPTPGAVYVLGVLGLAATGAGAYLEVSGLTKRSNLESCKPTCPQSSVDDALGITRAGDITLSVGIAALVGTAVLYLTRPPEAPPPASPASGDVDWLLGPTPGGLMAGVRGHL